MHWNWDNHFWNKKICTYLISIHSSSSIKNRINQTRRQTAEGGCIQNALALEQILAIKNYNCNESGWTLICRYESTWCCSQEYFHWEDTITWYSAVHIVHNTLHNTLVSGEPRHWPFNPLKVSLGSLWHNCITIVYQNYFSSTIINVFTTPFSIIAIIVIIKPFWSYSYWAMSKVS